MTSQTGASLGNRFGKLAIWASGNYQKSNSQPLTYVTSGSIPSGTTGGLPGEEQARRRGQRARRERAAEHAHDERQDQGGVRHHADAARVVHVRAVAERREQRRPAVHQHVGGQPTYAGQAGFATGYYQLDQRHTAQALTLRTDRKKDWDVELIGSTYRFNYDQQRSPASATATGTTFSTNGRVAVLDGTGWQRSTSRARGSRSGSSRAHTLSSGVHYEHYSLKNTTYNTSSWTDGGSRTDACSPKATGRRERRRSGLQDAWYITPDLKLTVGGRYEDWRGYDGLNVNGSTRVVQPTVEGQKFSPKAAPAPGTPRRSGRSRRPSPRRIASRPRPSSISSCPPGTTFTSPNPNLKPDNVTSTELRVERKFERARMQLSLFQDDVHDAIISQFNTLGGSTQLYSFVSNVDHVRARGAELAFGTNDILLRGLALSGNVTAVDPKTLAMSGRASATAARRCARSASSCRTSRSGAPRPRRCTARPSASPSRSRGRYSSKLYTTLDNADVRYNTYQGFSEWFVMDTKANYQVNQNWNASFGVDNLLDRKYFLFHPFPHRTFIAGLKYGFQ